MKTQADSVPGRSGRSVASLVAEVRKLASGYTAVREKSNTTRNSATPTHVHITVRGPTGALARPLAESEQ